MSAELLLFDYEFSRLDDEIERYEQLAISYGEKRYLTAVEGYELGILLGCKETFQNSEDWRYGIESAGSDLWEKIKKFFSDLIDKIINFFTKSSDNGSDGDKAKASMIGKRVKGIKEKLTAAAIKKELKFTADFSQCITKDVIGQTFQSLFADVEAALKTTNAQEIITAIKSAMDAASKSDADAVKEISVDIDSDIAKLMTKLSQSPAIKKLEKYGYTFDVGTGFIKKDINFAVGSGNTTVGISKLAEGGDLKDSTGYLEAIDKFFTEYDKFIGFIDMLNKEGKSVSDYLKQLKSQVSTIQPAPETKAPTSPISNDGAKKTASSSTAKMKQLQKAMKTVKLIFSFYQGLKALVFSGIGRVIKPLDVISKAAGTTVKNEKNESSTPTEVENTNSNNKGKNKKRKK